MTATVPKTSEFALVVENLSQYDGLSFTDFVVEDKARGNLDLIDAALRWLVNHGHARYDVPDGVYYHKPSLAELRDRLPDATVLPMRKT